MENVYEANFKSCPSCDVVNIKLCQKGPEFVHYAQTLYANFSLFGSILRWWCKSVGLQFQDFERKRIPLLTVPFTFDFHFSITISTWDTILGHFLSQFWVDDIGTCQTFKTLRQRFHKRIIHMKVNNRNTGTRCEIYSKLIIKTPERRRWRRSGVFIVNFEHISHIILVFLLLNLNM